MTLLSSNILGTHISPFNLEETLSMMSSAIEQGKKKRFCVTPVNCILWARKNQYLQNIYNSSDGNFADGVPVVWASKFLGEPIHGRVTGLDVLPAFSLIAGEKGFSFFFLGAKEGVAEKLSDELKRKFPTLKVAGTYSPPFAEQFSTDENEKMIAIINAVHPDVLWVSLTAPKQDYWIYEHFEKLNVKIAIGIGGAFEVTAGLIPRAPRWMQQLGFEWLYRLLREPRRMFYRYVIEAPRFIPLILLQKIKLLFNGT
jgi:N-acetylglucosaminyldiphosphoundecaprenol N-acetyl-beta-D-mannosaminyltransferase